MQIAKRRATRLAGVALVAAGMVTAMATAASTASASASTSATAPATGNTAGPAAVSPALSWPSGNITWRNAESGQFLESQGDNWSPSSWYNVNTGPDETCSPSTGNCFLGTNADQWVDPSLGGGVYYEVWAPSLTTKPNVTTADACLDSNSNSSTWGSGTGSAYVIPCNQGNYQKWHEVADSYGWRLYSNQTGLCLDGGAGPHNTGIYTYTCQSAGSDSYQRWH